MATKRKSATQEDSCSRTLGKRPCEEQKQLLLSFLEGNLPVARNQFEGSDGFKKLMSKWREAAELLNKIGPADKDGNGWKKFWEDWKNRIKKKYAAIKCQKMQSGINGPFIQFLDKMEQRFVGIITLDALDGDGKTPELGDPCVGAEASSSTTSLSPENTVEVAMPTTSPPILEPSASSSSTQPQSQRSNSLKRKLDDEMVLLQSLENIEQKKYSIDLERNEREKRNEERVAEEHVTKMELLKAKLELIKRQLN